MILNDRQIRAAVAEGKLGISPCSGERVDTGIVSYGMSSFGYDIRLDHQFAAMRDCVPLDPHAISEDDVVRDNIDQPFLMPAHSFLLAQSVEYIIMPEDWIALVVGKSTWARLGLIVNTTPLEPGWKGQITLELSNTTANPIVLYPGEGIAQVLFFSGEAPDHIYGGKYNFQGEPTLPIVPSVNK